MTVSRSQPCADKGPAALLAPKPLSDGWGAIRLYTRRTESGVGAHVVVEAERADGSSVELIREFADISDTTIDHWARLP